MFAPSQDINELRRLLASGQVTEDQLVGMTLRGRFGGGSPAPVGPGPQNELARILSPQEEFAQGGGEGDLPMGSMRNEATGKVTYFKPGGGGFSQQPYPANAAPQARPKIRLAGYGNGTLTDLGEEDARALPVDYTRPGIEIPGLGKGRYTADGRYAVIQGPNGEQTKVVLGYDADASDRRNDADLKRQRSRAEIRQTEQQIAQSQEQVAASVANRTRRDSGVQDILEKQYGKPDKGYRWTQDGKLEPLPGGEVEQKAQTAAEKARDAISQIDALIGKRGPKGEAVEGAQPHAGFEAAVGAGLGKTFGSLSDWFPFATAGRDFKKRFDQLKGGAFLEAFETLKGGGQITEVEGKKATAAITAMDTAQSEEEFVKAATEFRGVLERGMEKAKAKGGKVPESAMPATPAPAADAPAVGTIREGRGGAQYVFTGGDQFDKANWRKVR